MKGIIRAVLAILALGLVSCTSYPVKLVLDPPVFQDRDVRISYSVGAKIYFLTVLNKTDQLMRVDTENSSIVSVTGQTHKLVMHPQDTQIPPGAELVIPLAQDAIFGTDINSQFYESVYAAGQSEEETLRPFVGQLLRFYIPIVMGGEMKPYYFSVTVTNLTVYRPQVITVGGFTQPYVDGIGYIHQ